MDTLLCDGDDSEVCCRARSDTSSRVRQYHDWVPSMPRRQHSIHRLPNYDSPRDTLPASYSSRSISTPTFNQDFDNYNDILVERTPAGNSILSIPPSELLHATNNLIDHQQSDISAATRVQNSFHRLPKDSKYERILRGLIRRHEPLNSGFMLDDSALESILTAADTLFFDGALAGRVQWEWSSEPRYRTEIIGTTALRRCTRREGFETLIILSEPLLRNERYDRRLLLTTFIHELIHCYLFITCGFEARVEGGHTAGFHRIAEIIDSWVGPGFLSISKLREDPERFNIHTSLGIKQRQYSNYMQWETFRREKEIKPDNPPQHSFFIPLHESLIS
ncbi:hypothetical protein HI914_00363 [Erysiphe necator]|uniref:SprT-like domain-containing protein n=1 Tax=Uncinula necator TaxID=52586 RepID=A0A0B1PDA2_UNCNE|nr:hypothetical protein HI914_00363 [Erysiphe necator]KHJ34644.1 hypothetical protein EV44_g6063 [Erysiphe necator]